MAALYGLDLSPVVSGDPLSGDVRFQKLALPGWKKVVDSFRVLRREKTGKFIEFAVGFLGPFIPDFFRLKSFNQVEAFLYLAVGWVANLALLGVSCDFGVFNFLIGNVTGLR
ncbi:UNVERIFIED_CONTAM: hypothetical protein Sangu_1669300 [Sesamum angustifolium]|uniref:Uncharacterized protein n=1 Tax=Sesamum angustifolium TaxID=2727405 RepID=A0AAW2MLB2_9LAMI